MTASHHPVDLELARGLVAGREEAFREFFDEYFPRVYRFALARAGGDESLVEDVVQETLGSALRDIGGYRGEAALFSWLCTICRRILARHSASERLRRERFRLIEDSDEVRGALESLRSEAAEAESRLVDAEARRLVHVALDALPERYASCLEWKYFDELRVDEIAIRLGVSPKAAESVLTRARVAFRDALQALGSPGAPAVRRAT